MYQAQSMEDFEELLSKIGEVKVRYLVYKSNLRVLLSKANKNNDVSEVKRLSKEIKRVQEIYDNAWKDEELLKNYCSDEKKNSLFNKYTELLNEIIKLNGEEIEQNDLDKDDDELSNDEYTEVKHKKGILGSAVRVALAGSVLASGGITMAEYADYEESENEEISIDDILEDSKYDSLYDIKDDAQVLKRAEFIYENYFQGINNKELINEIANIIKVLNGELPINYSQESNLDLVEYYSNTFKNLYKISDNFIPSFLFTNDNTELSERLKINDDYFLRLEYYMKNGYTEEAKSISKTITQNMWCNFLIDTDTKKELLDYLSFVGPYEQMVFPIIYSSSDPINTYVMLESNGLDRTNRAHTGFSIKDIYEGLTTGRWSNEVLNAYEHFKTNAIQEDSAIITPVLNQISFYDILKVDLYNKLFFEKLLSTDQTVYESGKNEIKK